MLPMAAYWRLDIQTELGFLGSSRSLSRSVSLFLYRFCIVCPMALIFVRMIDNDALVIRRIDLFVVPGFCSFFGDSRCIGSMVVPRLF
ncbi:hypothetical protein BS50DRAFT_52444 [Corynespora cassiicola Philippines]|uniref:Uncharacterized protein n=1 Tax=Corynespora cassiicola Philippines TaxID=1448308 RepID=A0A2T2NI90_CORCC|nr:hypothetical protein BS50DRAFT_52444 [Corynespora cassiicola Philippines]